MYRDTATNWKEFGYKDAFGWGDKPPRVVKNDFLARHAQKQREFMNAVGKQIANLLYAARETDPWVISSAQRTPCEQALGFAFDTNQTLDTKWIACGDDRIWGWDELFKAAQPIKEDERTPKSDTVMYVHIETFECPS